MMSKIITSNFQSMDRVNTYFFLRKTRAVDMKNKKKCPKSCLGHLKWWVTAVALESKKILLKKFTQNKAFLYLSYSKNWKLILCMDLSFHPLPRLLSNQENNNFKLFCLKRIPIIRRTSEKSLLSGPSFILLQNKQ